MEEVYTVWTWILELIISVSANLQRAAAAKRESKQTEGNLLRMVADCVKQRMQSRGASGSGLAENWTLHLLH